jgi:hypothetical protein
MVREPGFNWDAVGLTLLAGVMTVRRGALGKSTAKALFRFVNSMNEAVRINEAKVADLLPSSKAAGAVVDNIVQQDESRRHLRCYNHLGDNKDRAEWTHETAQAMRDGDPEEPVEVGMRRAQRNQMRDKARLEHACLVRRYAGAQETSPNVGEIFSSSHDSAAYRSSNLLAKHLHKLAPSPIELALGKRLREVEEGNIGKHAAAKRLDILGERPGVCCWANEPSRQAKLDQLEMLKIALASGAEKSKKAKLSKKQAKLDAAKKAQAYLDNEAPIRALLGSLEFAGVAAFEKKPLTVKFLSVCAKTNSHLKLPKGKKEVVMEFFRHLGDAYTRNPQEFDVKAEADAARVAAITFAAAQAPAAVQQAPAPLHGTSLIFVHPPIAHCQNLWQAQHFCSRHHLIYLCRKPGHSQ